MWHHIGYNEESLPLAALSGLVVQVKTYLQRLT